MSSNKQNESINSIQACPLCGSYSYQVKMFRGERKFGNCDNCSLAFVQPFEFGQATDVQDSLSSITNPTYMAMMRDEAITREQIAQKMVIRRIPAYKALLGHIPRNICEIGAGDGAFAKAYNDLGIAYTGLDINRTIVETAQSLGRPVRLGGPELLVESGLQFDVIFASQVLEHILEPNSFLDTVQGLLADNGIFHVDVPNHNSLSSRIRRWFPGEQEYGFLQPPHHQIAYTNKTLRSILDQTGFRIIWIKPKGNFDRAWGQLSVGPQFLRRLGLRAAAFLRLGSLLVGLATKR